jgi:hypothetical protein
MRKNLIIVSLIFYCGNSILASSQSSTTSSASSSMSSAALVVKTMHAKTMHDVKGLKDHKGALDIKAQQATKEDAHAKEEAAATAQVKKSSILQLSPFRQFKNVSKFRVIDKNFFYVRQKADQEKEEHEKTEQEKIYRVTKLGELTVEREKGFGIRVLDQEGTVAVLELLPSNEEWIRIYRKQDAGFAIPGVRGSAMYWNKDNTLCWVLENEFMQKKMVLYKVTKDYRFEKVISILGYWVYWSCDEHFVGVTGINGVSMHKMEDLLKGNAESLLDIDALSFEFHPIIDTIFFYKSSKRELCLSEFDSNQFNSLLVWRARQGVILSGFLKNGNFQMTQRDLNTGEDSTCEYTFVNNTLNLLKPITKEYKGFVVAYLYNDKVLLHNRKLGHIILHDDQSNQEILPLNLDVKGFDQKKDYNVSASERLVFVKQNSLLLVYDLRSIAAWQHTYATVFPPLVEGEIESALAGFILGEQQLPKVITPKKDAEEEILKAALKKAEEDKINAQDYQQKLFASITSADNEAEIEKYISYYTLNYRMMDGDTPLIKALRFHAPKCARVLLAHGNSIRFTQYHQEQVKVNLGLSDAQQNTPLHVAIATKQFDIALEIAQKMDAKTRLLKNTEGKTAFDLMENLKEQYCQDEIFNRLYSLLAPAK